MRNEAITAVSDGEDSPLISTRFLMIATCTIIALAAASFAISWFGRAYGERLSLAGHSESKEILDIIVGRDRLALAANTIRFEGQRQNGGAERVDLYLLWPEMTGYSTETRRRFDDLTLRDSLIFLQVSQSTMSRDMSGRLEPIYRHLLETQGQAGPAGLTRYDFKSGTGYDGESLFTGNLSDGTSYAIRCLLPERQEDAGGSDCQRDIHVGEDLTVLYRFPSTLLSDWEAIDLSVRDYIASRASPAPVTPTLKNAHNGSTDRSS